MAKVLVYAWEIGAAAVLSQVLPVLVGQGHSCVVAALAPAFDCFKDRCPAEIQVLHATSDVVTQDFDVCVAGYGSPARSDAMKLWEVIARKMPTLVVLDQWKGLDRFFDAEGLVRVPCPSRIAVAADSIADSLIEAGIPEQQLVVVGHPSLAACAEKTFLAGLPSRMALRERLGIDAEVRVYVMASEGVHSGHQGWMGCDSRCRKLFSCESQGRPLWNHLLEKESHEASLFLLRPHPSDSNIASDNILSVPWDRLDDKSLLVLADRVYGISSMLLLQAAALGIETVNLQPMLSDWQPEHSFLSPVVYEDMVNSGMFDHNIAPDVARKVHVGAVARIVEQLSLLVDSGPAGGHYDR